MRDGAQDTLKPLLLVDGDSIFFRAFFALPDSIKGSDGRPVNALLGAANLILREIDVHDPRAVVVCFGAEAAHYRKELYEGYHAARPPLPDDLAHQYGLVQDWFKSFGWTVAISDTLEADDLLGSYASREADAGGHALIMTGDRDLYQCARDGVTVLYVSTGKQGGQLVDAAEVERRYGIPPELVPDFIALRGDPSDGIPGAKGIGEKTAAELLREHGSLEDVIEKAADDRRKAVRFGVTADPELLLKFKDIATIRDVDVKLPKDTPLDRKAASAAAERLGMSALSKRLADGG